MNKRIFLLISLVCAVAALVWFFRRTPHLSEQTDTVLPNEPALTKGTNYIRTRPSQIDAPRERPRVLQAQNDQMNRAREAEAAAWQSYLTYYGEVIDESNRPIAGVQVAYSANSLNDLREESYNTGTVTTDERGMFKIDGVQGINLMVQLSHPQYYAYPDNSTGFDKRALPKKGYFADSEQNAEIFRMHSKGHPVPLVHRSVGMNVAMNGAQNVLYLRGVDGIQEIGQLLIVATGTPSQQSNRQPFDWDVTVSMLSGGFIEYTNQFDFTAPEIGYKPKIEFDFPKNMVGWTDTVSKNYFVKLPSGFARLNVYIGAKRSLFFSVDYDYNEDGSSNLERVR